MEASQVHCLTALLVFENTINKELVRSLHVYRLKDGKEKQVEREFLLSTDGPYIEMATNPTLRLRVLEVFEGQVMDVWRCIFGFHLPHHFTSIPSLLSISRNPKLKSIPSLANDLQLISKLSRTTDDKDSSQFSSREVCEEARDDGHQSKRSLPILEQDLNCLPYSVDASELSKSGQIEHNSPGVVAMKKKRAATEDIARIALEDLVRYFHLPIMEASRNLKVGVTVLKKKCREFGIPRWPHRKIKSLDCLIHSLQNGRSRRTKMLQWQLQRGKGCWRGKSKQ